MKVTYFPKKIDQKSATLVLGSFETIHNGHLKLLTKAQNEKKPIHVMIIDNISAIPAASQVAYENLEIRLQKFANLKVDKITIVHFDQKIRKMEGKKFIADLVDLTNAKKIVVGEDFACGHHRAYKAGDIANDYPTIIVKHQKINNVKISTSLLKELVLTGEMDTIKKLAPFPFCIKTTINTAYEFEVKDIMPHPGIYIVSAIINDIQYWGYVHFSQRNKNYISLNGFNNHDRSWEAFIYFHKASRIIISTSNDQVTNDDKKRIDQYFQAH